MDGQVHRRTMPTRCARQGAGVREHTEPFGYVSSGQVATTSPPSRRGGSEGSTVQTAGQQGMVRCGRSALGAIKKTVNPQELRRPNGGPEANDLGNRLGWGGTSFRLRSCTTLTSRRHARFHPIQHLSHGNLWGTKQPNSGSKKV